MAKADKGNDLDFTGIFSVKTPAAIAPPVPRKLPEDIVIGAKALKKGGYFVNITNPRAKTVARPESATVLIVEDEPSTLLLIDHVLAKAGYRTRMAANGATFVALIKVPPIPNLILLDIELPDVSGTHILAKLRAHPQTRFVPIWCSARARSRRTSSSA